MTRPKPTKHVARPARRGRRDRAGQPASPQPATTPTAADSPPDTATRTTATNPTAPAATAPAATKTRPAAPAPTPGPTPANPATEPQGPESASAGLVIADLALHTVRASPAALPDVLLARCEWAAALPPAARRQFADATARALRLAAPESLQDELAGVLATWHDTARSFGAA